MLRKVVGMMMLTSMLINMIITATLIWCVAVNKDFVPTLVSMYKHHEMVMIYEKAYDCELPD